ncbi:glycoside hydrolase family 20 protein [Streptomyces ficellus]|uniref:Glycoside hydrolase family 20 protein n=1 Tax=Streptomyces ficellus TaxID=1977088 RepID=A0ABT7Z901_9ACTN|nr:glycoside hydrolase family 20 protein [Streptomyces ficellus]MDN3295936.1 glycoside hydrolase family 20 protein [Streptomyces ficellus]
MDGGKRVIRHSTGGLVAAVVLSLTVAGCADSGTGGQGTAAPGTATTPAASTPGALTPTPTPTPSPTRTYPLSTEPRTIPSVRDHQPARGPGWRPGSGSAVVVAKGSGVLADEARLLAGELKAGYRGEGTARAGDIELALNTTQGGGAESYTLTTRNGRVRITGPDQAGVFYGTRTVKQALRSGGTVPEGVIRDRPAKPQRGLNLDIARKHFSAQWIEARLRDMADLKLNQLGLHFSDDQAFRIESSSHPEVVSPQHLTKAEVRRILALASRLHITVVPEVDSPGHLGAVLRAHPQLQLRNTQGTPRQGAIDISKPESARIVDDLLREYARLFPGRWFHVGADEYQALTVRDPAASYPQLARAARQKYGPGARVQDLATGWLNDRAAVVRAAGRTPKAWNDGFFTGGVVSPHQGIEAEYWTGREIGAREPLSYLREGRKVVNLNDEYLYYVLGEPNQFTYPTGRRIYQEWTPLVLRGSTAVPERYAGQILGGRFAVWCDLANAQTADQVARGIRMPLRATAQKLWDAGQPPLSWADFRTLADRLGGGT